MSDSTAVPGMQAQGQRAPAPPLIAALFARLADGVFHSGEALAQEFEVSRSAIWKAVRVLRQLGVPVNAVRNRGYQLTSPTDLLTAERISDRLPQDARDRLASLVTLWSVDSTNTRLAADLPRVGTAHALLAEHQSAGRGRQGRSWLAPPGGAICLSVSWTFAQLPRDIGSLSLVVGVCALRAMRSFQLGNITLKWPNDLLVGGRKLGGILIELRAESGGPASVVIGIGVNVALGPDLLQSIGQLGLPPTDLVTAGLQGQRRNEIAAALIAECIRGVIDFERQGLKPFVQEWLAADALRGREISVRTGIGEFGGVARGIDLDGALMVETPSELMRFVSGDVSVRPV
jgi:BirA family transcriptional regulator, biotin operon repressor / biotin---[acetyl-CoA-carboxylase] ligase